MLGGALQHGLVAYCLSQLHQLDVFRRDWIVGDRAVWIRKLERGCGGDGSGRREGDFRSNLDIDVVGQPEVGFEFVVLAEVGCRMVIQIDAGLPCGWILEIVGGHAQRGEDELGALGIDHVGGQGFDDLSERGLYGVHVFQRRQVEMEMLAAGAGLGHAHEASAVAEVVAAVVAAGDGGGAAVVSIVVEMIATDLWQARHISNCHHERSEGSVFFGTTTGFRNSTGFPQSCARSSHVGFSRSISATRLTWATPFAARRKSRAGIALNLKSEVEPCDSSFLGTWERG